ncbi:hypothetical protein PLICRDRAFT_41943 [Plicaturopsis crispa FD-325 SS-3]|nr:hypothetical protein PLICRDRAFT_41943 [Plicaturopsis crispa FD-325 SS-3]
MPQENSSAQHGHRFLWAPQNATLTPFERKDALPEFPPVPANFQRQCDVRSFLFFPMFRRNVRQVSAPRQ